MVQGRVSTEPDQDTKPVNAQQQYILNTQQMTDALVLAGAYLRQHADQQKSDHPDLQRLNAAFYASFEATILREHTFNAWFTEEQVRRAIENIAVLLTSTDLSRWLGMYPELPGNGPQKTIGVVMAGNIPLVGFHDLLSVLLSGHKFLGKPSSKDDHLLRSITELLCAIEPEFADRISYTEGYLKDADAIIATGSDNTARHFEYYFRDIPHIIRRNRNGVAVLTGNETRDELLGLGDDIFAYFGLGCRNVTKIFIPVGYPLERLLESLEYFSSLRDHHKYANNLEYNRSVYLMNSISFLDNGVLLLKEDERYSSPVGVVYYETYTELDNVVKKIILEQEQVQCVVTIAEGIENAVAPGNSQSPALWDYADGVDTMKFLTDLSQ